jgi:ABC-type polysaccharide/polyol phosphate export permease
MNLLLKAPLSDAWRDIRSALHNHHLTTTLGWQDIATRYRRSRVGAFWLTINMAVLIGALGFVFGTLFSQPMNEFLPYLAIGTIVWGFLSAVISEGCTGFVSAEGIILQVRMPLFTHVTRILWRNIIILGHNLLILPLLFLVFMKPVSPLALLVVPGFVLLVFNAAWMMLILAVVCARFRDMPQIVLNVMQVLFYLTPIIWSAALLPERAGTAMLNLNPFYHLISIVREPLLGEVPTIMNWAFSSLMMIFGWTVALLIFGHYRKRVPYWL